MLPRNSVDRSWRAQCMARASRRFVKRCRVDKAAPHYYHCHLSWGSEGSSVSFKRTSCGPFSVFI